MKTRLMNQKNQYLTIIYNDTLKHKSVKDIHRDLLKLTINPNKPLLGYMLKLANRTKKLDKGPGQYYGSAGLDVLAVAILSLYSKQAVNYQASLIVHSQVRKFESDKKIEILDNSFKENRKNGQIFYVASSHKDSAKDHEPWQGKVYVDRYWHNYDTDGSLEKYIKENDIRTVQWVTSKPVYFITRPNCRHYFTTYNIEQILNGEYKIPNRKIGDKRLQTPRDANLQYYEDRLRLLRNMYRKYATDNLKRQIDKTKLLVTKWKKQF